MTVFVRLLEVAIDEKASALREVVSGLARGHHPVLGKGRAWEREPKVFAGVPGSPFAYWAPARCLELFSALEAFGSAPRLVVSTNPLNADFRYVRLWWEVAHEGLGSEWRPWAKGGAYSPYYYDVNTVIAWSDRQCSYRGFLGTENRPLERPASVQHFFRPGLTWPRRTTSGLGLRVKPSGCIFADKGPAVFVEGDALPDLLAFSAIMNSAIFRYLVAVQLAAADAAARSYEVGVIQRTPVPRLAREDVDALGALARRGWSLKRRHDTRNETSHAFLLPPGPNERVTEFDCAAIDHELRAIQRSIDQLSFTLYNVSPADQTTIEAWAKNAETASDDEFEDDPVADIDKQADAPNSALLSWLVGAAFGRFDTRIAAGKRQIPADPGPFDPLPFRSPGMLPEGESPDFTPPAILVDDSGREHDLASQIASAGASAGCSAPDDPRQWFAREFFSLHIKMYSKSRRKAPIYWQLAPPSASYSVWLYIHAFTKDTLYKVQNEFAGPKLKHEERKLESMCADKAPSKELAAQQQFVEELRAFLDEVKRVAPLWNPDLDDGVIINAAPLWRLFPQHKPWQKECKECWDKLCAGEYDWAHLAMHLWPERVVPKCATDRSLAIAHDLEDVFWQEIDGKWKARSKATRDLDAIVRERTSPAVKNALQSLLNAPSQGASARGRSKRKAKVDA